MVLPLFFRTSLSREITHLPLSIWLRYITKAIGPPVTERPDPYSPSTLLKNADSLLDHDCLQASSKAIQKKAFLTTVSTEVAKNAFTQKHCFFFKSMVHCCRVMKFPTFMTCFAGLGVRVPNTQPGCGLSSS
jgi:hypothetical protein